MRRPVKARLGLLAGLGLLAALPASADVQVAVNEGRVDLSATSAPLADVLDRLARQTQMQVTYEGAPPRNLVTASVQALTPAQAVLSVLEGLGLNYALQLDRTGQQVRTLLLVASRGGTAAPKPTAAPESAPPHLRAPTPPLDEADEDVMDDDDPPVEVPPGRPVERMARPGRQRPDRPGVPGVFDPSAPSQAVPFPTPPPAATYPVSPFAPVVPPSIQVIQPPQVPTDPDPPSER